MRRRDCTTGMLSLGLAGLRGKPAHAETRTLKIATIGLANSPWDMALRRFKQVVEAESGGRYAVNVYTDGQLGDIAQLLSAMQLGTIEFSAFGLTSISFVRGGEPLNVTYAPYLFPSAAAAERVLNNGEFRAIYEKIGQAAGVRVFGAYGQRSPRALQTVSGPITGPGQVRGMRLRIPAIPMLKAVFERLGAQITPLGMLEILQRPVARHDRRAGQRVRPVGSRALPRRGEILVGYQPRVRAGGLLRLRAVLARSAARRSRPVRGRGQGRGRRHHGADQEAR